MICAGECYGPVRCWVTHEDGYSATRCGFEMIPYDVVQLG